MLQWAKKLIIIKNLEVRMVYQRKHPERCNQWNCIKFRLLLLTELGNTLQMSKHEGRGYDSVRNERKESPRSRKQELDGWGLHVTLDVSVSSSVSEKALQVNSSIKCLNCVWFGQMKYFPPSLYTAICSDIEIIALAGREAERRIHQASP